MRRSLGLLAAVIALAAAPAGAREPLDFDLSRLGPPTSAIWLAQLGCVAPCSAQEQADAAAMAGDARVRFARLATDLALALSSTLAQPASTTGLLGFQINLETGYTALSHRAIGGGNTSFPTAAEGGGARDYWPSRTAPSGALLTPSVHLRKGLPYSLELGGRLTYLAQSSYFATQLEGKWALVEGYALWPEVAVRGAWTRLFGQRDLELSTTELDLMASKRFGVSAVASVTPYLALRLTRLSASTRTLAFRDVAPADPADSAYAAFPDLEGNLYRTTAGARLTTYAVALAAEVTYYGGGTFGKAAPDAAYPRYFVPASISGAFKFGFEF